MSVWSFRYNKKFFSDQLTRWDTEFKHAAWRVRRSEIGSLRAKREARRQEFKKFLLELKKLTTSSDPVSLLRASIDIEMADLRVLRSGPWTACFIVDRKEHALLGLLVYRDKPDDLISNINRALDRKNVETLKPRGPPRDNKPPAST